MSRNPSTEKQYQVKTQLAHVTKKQSNADNFGNADLIINDDEVGNFKTAQKAKQRTMASPSPFVKINQQHTPTLTHNRSQGSIDTLPLSKGTPGFTNQPVQIIKQMHHTVREGQSPYGGFIHDEQDGKQNAYSGESQQNEKHLLPQIESARYEERTYNRKKLSQDIIKSQRSSSFRNSKARRNTDSKEENSAGGSPTRTHRKTVTLALTSGHTDDHHTNNTHSVQTDSQDELISASINKDTLIHINNFENVVKNRGSFEKTQFQKPSIVSLLNIPDSTGSVGESSLRDMGHPLYLGMQNQEPKFSSRGDRRVKSLSKENQKALFEHLTLKTEESEEQKEDSEMKRLRAILLKAMKMNKSSIDKNWNQMTPFERSKIKADFEELLRNVSVAEKLGLTIEVTERRQPQDLIQGLNSCLSAEPAQKSKRPYQNSPIIAHTSGFQFRDAVNKKMVSKKQHRGGENIVVIRNELGAAEKGTNSVSDITGNNSILGGWDKQEKRPGGEATPHFEKKSSKLKVVELAKNKKKSNSTVPTSPKSQLRKTLTKSQATETELDAIQQPSRNTVRESLPQDRLPQTSHNTPAFKNEVWTQKHGKIASGQQSRQEFKLSAELIPLGGDTVNDGEKPNLWVETQPQSNYIEFQDQIFAHTYTGPEQAERLNDESELQPQQDTAEPPDGFITTGKLPSVVSPVSPSEVGKDTYQSSHQKMAQIAAMKQSQVSRDVFAKLVEMTKKHSNSSGEDPDKIVESTLTAISLTKQYKIGSAATPQAPFAPKTDHNDHQATKRSDLGHLYTVAEALPQAADLGNPLKITPYDTKRSPYVIEQVKVLNSVDTESVASESDVMTKGDPVNSHRNIEFRRPSNQVSVTNEANNTDLRNLKCSDAIVSHDQELKSRNADKAGTQSCSLQLSSFANIHVVKTDQNVDRVPLFLVPQTSVGNTHTLVNVESGVADSEISPLQLVAKLNIGNSDPALKKKKAENPKKWDRANGNNPKQKSTMRNNRLHPHQAQLHISPEAHRNTLVTGWETNPSHSGFVNRDSSVDILAPTLVQLQNSNQQQQDHTSSTRAKLQLLERRMAEHNAPVPSKFKLNNKKHSLSKVNMSQLVNRQTRRRSDLKGRQSDALNSAVQELDGSQLRGGIKGVKKNLMKAQEKYNSSKRVSENGSRLTAKFVETEINNSIEAFCPPANQGEQMLQRGMLTTVSSKFAVIEYVEVEGKTIDPIIMFKKDGKNNSAVKTHNNSVGQLNPTFPKKISKGPTTDSMHSSARSPFKVQAACQANAKTPSNRSESDYFVASQKQETAQPQNRSSIVGNVANVTKLNLTTMEGFKSTNYMINVQNPVEADCLNSEEMLQSEQEPQQRGDEQNNVNVQAEEVNEKRPSAIDMVVTDHKYQLNEESQMSNRRPTELRQKSQAKQVIGNRSQSLAPPENHNIKVSSLRQTIVATLKNTKIEKIQNDGDNKNDQFSTQKDNPQIFNEEELPRQTMQAVKKLDLRTPLHKLLTSEQMEELQTLLGSKTYRRKQARHKAYLMGPQQIDEEGEAEVSRNNRAHQTYRSVRDANSLRTSPVLKLSDPSTVKTVLPSLKHPAFNIANGPDLEYSQAIYSKQRTTEHINRVKKLSAAKQTSLILLDPLAGQIKIKNKTSQPFNSSQMAPGPKIATKDKEIIFSNSTTVKKLQIKSPQPHQVGSGIGQKQRTARNSPFLTSGPFSVASPQASTTTQTQAMTATGLKTSTTMAASARMPNVSKRYHSKQKNGGETFIFNDINRLDEDLKKNSALVDKLFKSNAQ